MVLTTSTVLFATLVLLQFSDNTSMVELLSARRPVSKGTVLARSTQ